jgi:hypothetical protein
LLREPDDRLPFAAPSRAARPRRNGQDNVIAPTTPEAAARVLENAQERYARLVKKANITLD